MKRLLALLAVAALTVLLSASQSAAQIWNEVGDAGDLPGTAQIPTGNGSLLQINGFFEPDGDADLYCITVPNPDVFVATTCGVTNADTQLWIFALDGTGLSHNDDDPGGCGLQSSVTGAFLPGPGQYLIGVSPYNWDALNAAGQTIWANSPFNDETPPDGDGAGDPVLASWGTTAFYSEAYTIIFTGAEFCDVTATEESSWSTLKGTYR